MTPLGRVLAERIRREGPLPVAEYMAICLGDPAHGYYRHADAVGAAGDFITAPEVSQMFGELIGLWAAAVWTSIGQPPALRLVELGPGRGTLMADALRAIARAAPTFHAAIDLHLVEINPRLRARQEAALAAVRPTWHESIATVPQGPAIFIANEFFDALPVGQYERTADGWRERCVGLDGGTGRLAFTSGAIVDDPPLEPAQRDAGVGAIVEVSPAGRALAAAIAARIAAQGGAALIVDYGAPASGTGDTLQAVHRHRKVDALEAPGESRPDRACRLRSPRARRLGRRRQAVWAGPAGPVSQPHRHCRARGDAAAHRHACAGARHRDRERALDRRGANGHFVQGAGAGCTRYARAARFRPHPQPSLSTHAC